MSWSVSASGTKAEVTAKVDAEHQTGRMPDSHRTAVLAELEQCAGERVSISASGHRQELGGGGSISLQVYNIS